MRKLFFIFTLLLGCTCVSMAQTSRLNELEQQKKKTKSEIEKTNKLLHQTNKNAKASLQQLNLLNKQIKLQKELLVQIDSELNILSEQVKMNRYVVDNLRNDLDEINMSYARMIRFARKNQNDNDQLYFLLSSESFNQAYERFIHLRQLTAYRRKQSEAVKSVHFFLEEKAIQLDLQIEQKAEARGAKLNESMALQEQKQQQDHYHNNLIQKEKILKKKLSQQRRIADNLDNEIEKAIAEAARKAREEESKRLSIANKKLSDSFADNKGKLPWPVDNGVVTDKFGEHPHPVLKKVKIKNSGIDIATTKGQNAKSVFKGEVSRVLAIPGANKAVIVRHGSYLSVYSNLSKVYVRPGETLVTGQIIGRVYTDKIENNTTTLKFQIWKESTKQNPELWLQKVL